MSSAVSVGFAEGGALAYVQFWLTDTTTGEYRLLRFAGFGMGFGAGASRSWSTSTPVSASGEFYTDDKITFHDFNGVLGEVIQASVDFLVAGYGATSVHFNSPVTDRFWINCSGPQSFGIGLSASATGGTFEFAE